MNAEKSGTTQVSGKEWWAHHRFRYNVGLISAILLAFICYIMVIFLGNLVRPVPSSFHITVMPLWKRFLPQEIGCIMLVGIANIFYSLAPVVEHIIQPVDVGKFRKTAFQIGLWFSILLPFTAPILIFCVIIAMFIESH